MRLFLVPVLLSAQVSLVQGQYGWDVLRAANAVKKAAQAEGHEAGVKAANAVHKRASRVSLVKCQRNHLAFILH